MSSEHEEQKSLSEQYVKLHNAIDRAEKLLSSTRAQLEVDRNERDSVLKRLAYITDPGSMRIFRSGVDNILIKKPWRQAGNEEIEIIVQRDEEAYAKKLADDAEEENRRAYS